MDTVSSQPGDLVVQLPQMQPYAAASDLNPELALALAQELWIAAAGEACDISRDEFAAALGTVGEKLNHGSPPAAHPEAAQKITFYRGLHLPEFALAQGCALGREAAWERFLDLYREPLTRAAIAITGSATLGHELADSLYAELYGFKKGDGERRSPLASYTGRGSLMGWLRTTLAQRHVDHHRRTRREVSLEGIDAPAPTVSAPSSAKESTRLTTAVAQTLQSLPPEDRFILSAYFLDRQTLLRVGRTLGVHEATISRRLKRLTDGLRTLLLDHLQSSGLSRRAAEEALGADPRDIEINLRSMLQTSQTASFLNRDTDTDTDKTAHHR